MNKKRVSRLDVKKAVLTDKRFRELFPELQEDISKILSNPSCACNISHYDKFFKYKDRLALYFQDWEIKSPQEEAIEDSQNQWSVVNCNINELEDVLNSLHKNGRSQVAIARYEDQITLVVNNMGVW